MGRWELQVVLDKEICFEVELRSIARRVLYCETTNLVKDTLEVELSGSNLVFVCTNMVLLCTKLVFCIFFFWGQLVFYKFCNTLVEDVWLIREW